MDPGEMVSGQELWERICSGLAAQPRNGNDAQSPPECCRPESFWETFSPVPEEEPDMDSGSSNGDPARGTAWTPMPDSQQYLAALESRLRKLKGLNEEPSSKEMLLSLSQTKKECWDRFLHEQYASDVYSNGYEMDQSAIDHFKRWLQPERVPLSSEEVQYLINLEGQSASQEELENESCSACEQ